MSSPCVKRHASGRIYLYPGERRRNLKPGSDQVIPQVSLESH